MVLNATASPQTLCSPKSRDPKAILNLCLPFAMIKGLLCLPHPFQPPSLALGFLRLVTQQPKLKFPRADNSNSLSEEACREGILIHQGLLAFTPQPSLALSLASRYLSFQTTGCPSEVRTPVPLGIRTCYTHTAPTMLPPTAPAFRPCTDRRGSIPGGTRQVCPHLELSPSGSEGSGSALRAPLVMGHWRKDGRELERQAGDFVTWGKSSVWWVWGVGWRRRRGHQKMEV